jgi:hypothetical protein
VHPRPGALLPAGDFFENLVIQIRRFAHMMSQQQLVAVSSGIRKANPGRKTIGRSRFTRL